MEKIEEKLKDMGIELPACPVPVASYVPAVRFCGTLVYVSGQDCRTDGKLLYEGKLGAEVSLEEGQASARQCAVNCLAALKSCIGSLDKVKRVVKLLGFVSSAPGFGQQPYVLNGASDLLVALFGDNGRHARAAIGVNELPFNAPVEVEMIFEVEPEAEA